MKQKLTFLLLIFSIVLVGCDSISGGSSNDSSTDPEAAQQLLPAITTYQTYNADNVVDAITRAGGSAALVSGNIQLTALIAKIDQTIECYQRVGAVAANIYVQTDIGRVLEGNIPSTGVVAVVNQTRIQDNFANCILGQSDEASAQNVQIEPCTGSGSFTYLGDQFTYIYAGTEPGFCGIVQNHFNSVQANNS